MKNREYVISRMGTRIDFGNSIGEAVDDLEECLEAYKETRWIPVSDRLPEKEEYTHGIFDEAEFIVLIDGAELPTTLYFNGYEWFDFNFGEYDDIRTTYNVTHWMSLPSIPSEGKI